MSWSDIDPSHRIPLSVKRYITIGCMGFLAVLLVSCASPETPPPTPFPTLAEAENAVFISITTSPYTIEKDSDGFDTIRIEDYSLGGVPGEAALPKKEFSIALPPDVAPASVQVQVVDFALKTLEGSYKIKQAVADQPSGEGDSSTAKDISGEDIIQMLNLGQMRKWQFIKVAYFPFHFDPDSGTLTAVSEVQLRIVYDLSSEPLDPALLADKTMDDMAEETFMNFEDARDWYQLQD